MLALCCPAPQGIIISLDLYNKRGVRCSCDARIGIVHTCECPALFVIHLRRFLRASYETGDLVYHRTRSEKKFRQVKVFEVARESGKDCSFYLMKDVQEVPRRPLCAAEHDVWQAATTSSVVDDYCNIMVGAESTGHQWEDLFTALRWRRARSVKGVFQRCLPSTLHAKSFYGPSRRVTSWSVMRPSGRI